MSPEERRAPLPVLFSDQSFEKGEPVMSVFSANLSDLTGIQFSVHFDPEVLVFEKIVPLAENLLPEHIATNQTGRGLLSWSFDRSGQVLNNGMEPLFEVHFRARKNGSTSAAMQISDAPTLAYAYRADGSAYKPVLLPKPEKDVVFAAPNPFGRSGCWLYYPEIKTGEQELQIVDSQGKTLLRQGLPANGPWFISSGLLPVSGTYNYRIVNTVSGKRVAGGRLVFLN
jgi:hypothetical protein